MHPRINSYESASRPASPSASLGVPVGSPSFASTTARTAHTPSADATGAARSAAHAQASADSRDPGGPDLAPFAPSEGSPTDGERVQPVGSPADDGLTAEGPATPNTQASARDVEGGGAEGADLADVIDAGDGAAPADAAARGGTQD